jgi:RNA polymerase sigma-70 factor (ECF subfamily)
MVFFSNKNKIPRKADVFRGMELAVFFIRNKKGRLSSFGFCLANFASELIYPERERCDKNTITCLFLFIEAFNRFATFLPIVVLFMDAVNPAEPEELLPETRQLYESLFKRYFRILVMYALRLVQKMEIAEEIVQNVFFKLWERREKIDTTDNIQGYLYRAVYNESMSHLREEKKNQEIYVELTEVISPLEEFNDLVHRAEVMDKIKESIANLPEKTREVFEMSRYEMLTYAQISEKLNITIKGVEFHMTKAIRQLREELKDFL